MEKGMILSADVLDIIFDQRNKAYGAYDLRKHYQQHLMKALTVTISLTAFICLAYVLMGAVKPATAELVTDGIITLEKVPTEKPLQLPPPAQKIIPPPAVMTRQFTKPLIVAIDPPENERPPEQTALESVQIGKLNRDGKDFDGLQEAPVPAATGVIETPKKQGEGDDAFRVVEIESQYPGGMQAWAKFLNATLSYPPDAADERVEGTVYVEFIVDVTGAVSQVTAISGPPALRNAATAVITKSARWIPAIQNGRHVKSYKKQGITFKLQE